MAEKQKGLFREEQILFSDDAFKLTIRKKTLPDKTALQVNSQFIHPELEIKLFLDGSASLLIGDEHVMARANDIVIVNPFENHTTIDTQNCAYYLFLISLDFIKPESASGLDLERLTLKKQIRFHHLIRNNAPLLQLLREIAKEETQKKAYYETVIYGKMVAFFSLLLRQEVDEENTATVAAESMKYYHIIEPAFLKIRNDYEKEMTVTELANICCVSKSHFCRIFKKVTNQTVGRYITEYRLRIAHGMLESSELTIGQIAQECGFEDPGYFGRCYKKKYGMPPGKTKQKQGK